MIRSRRLPRRSSLLVLSIALAIGSSVSDVLVQGAAGVEPEAAPATERATPSLPPVDQVVDCLSGGVVAPFATHAHRDDVSTHPGGAPSDGCRLAGPKRFHGPGATIGALADPGIAASTMAPATVVAMAANERWSGSFNLYRKSAFVTQKDFKWCVAASVQMMVNMVRHRSDRTAATQERMILYAQASDHGPYGPGGGTDVTGWIAALRHFGAGKYRAVGARTQAAALRIAATAMRQTGRPAGMLVMEGRHAWILHGFESRTDPEHNRWARITSVRVSGPLYPVQQKNGYDLRPNTELSVRALARYFTPSSVGALVGKYVVIVPTH